MQLRAVCAKKTDCGIGKETVWTIHFNMPATAKGTAALRVALAGVSGMRNGLPVTLNGTSIARSALGQNRASTIT
jgi:hypothetical protein